MAVSLAVAGAVGAGALVVGTAGGFALGRSSGDDSGRSPLGQPARVLGVEAERGAVTDAVEDLVDAVDTTLREARLEQDTPRDASAPERARALQDAVRSGELLEETPDVSRSAADADTGSDAQGDDVEPGHTDEHEGEGEPSDAEAGRETVERAVETAQRDVTPETETARRLLDYLDEPTDIDERQLRETLTSTVQSLNRLATLDDAFGGVDPHVDDQQLSEDLRTHAAGLSGPAGDALTTLADRLAETNQTLEECQSERQSLLESAERVCAAVEEQSSVSFESGETAEQLATVERATERGDLAFEDEQSSVARVAQRARQTASPESALATDLLDELSDESGRRDLEGTLTDVVEAVDRAETVRHRLEGVEPDDVEQLAGRIEGELAGVDASAAPFLEERVADLEDTVAQAGSTDLVTVYAARQELRFYDRKLLPELRNRTSEADGTPDVEEKRKEVEERRSSMRSEYPSQYPEHDHSIPIHFLELVESLEQDAADLERSGRQERAMGYLEAADETLDWVAELYERHAYNVLLEQLRG